MRRCIATKTRFAKPVSMVCMKAHFKEILLALIVLLSTAYLLSSWRGTPKSQAPSSGVEDCQSEEFVMPDSWLTGRLAPGENFRAITNWSACGRGIQRGDVVLYQVSKAHEPVARIVAAQPGDRFRLIAVANGWNIEVEGRLYMDESGVEPYRFGSPAPPLIRIYEEAHQGILDSTSLLLFSTKSPGDQDSGSLGVLNTADVSGIVNPP